MCAARLIAQASARMDRTTAGSLMVTDIRESARQESVNSLVQLSCICAILAVAAGLFRYDLEVRNAKLTSWLPPALLRCATRQHSQVGPELRVRRNRRALWLCRPGHGLHSLQIVVLRPIASMKKKLAQLSSNPLANVASTASAQSSSNANPVDSVVEESETFVTEVSKLSALVTWHCFSNAHPHFMNLVFVPVSHRQPPCLYDTLNTFLARMAQTSLPKTSTKAAPANSLYVPSIACARAAHSPGIGQIRPPGGRRVQPP
jgi:hypothetical protein